ncbi:unnamed protein product [Soboliphyme baturini]|uniref:non-specific serine/threonine protein kinase n=1 Tax=Soboliphyme baturini TaxID=241478 RepID=A0A183ID74_9BILA|nr:unnamed protein product [Soboliphyme baturini]
MFRLLAYAGRMVRLARFEFFRFFGSTRSLLVSRNVLTKAAGIARVTFRGPILNRIFRSFTPNSRFTLLRAALVGTSLRWPGTFTMRRYCWTSGMLIRNFSPDRYAVTITQSLKNAFVYRMNQASTEYPASLSAYEIGRHISNGCNAAVYEARLRELTHLETETSTNIASAAGTSLVSSGRFRNRPSKNILSSKIDDYPLAIKMMFNYGMANRRDFVFYEMGPELVPACCCSTSIHIREKMLPRPHPNIVRMFSAFVDQVPLFPDSEALYPAALPRLQFDEGYGHNETLFIVMKRQ